MDGTETDDHPRTFLRYLVKEGCFVRVHQRRKSGSRPKSKKVDKSSKDRDEATKPASTDSAMSSSAKKEEKTTTVVLPSKKHLDDTNPSCTDDCSNAKSYAAGTKCVKGLSKKHEKSMYKYSGTNSVHETTDKTCDKTSQEKRRKSHCDDELKPQRVSEILDVKTAHRSKSKDITSKKTSSCDVSNTKSVTHAAISFSARCPIQSLVEEKKIVKESQKEKQKSLCKDLTTKAFSEKTEAKTSMNISGDRTLKKTSTNDVSDTRSKVYAETSCSAGHSLEYVAEEKSLLKESTTQHWKSPCVESKKISSRKDSNTKSVIHTENSSSAKHSLESSAKEKSHVKESHNRNQKSLCDDTESKSVSEKTGAEITSQCKVEERKLRKPFTSGDSVIGASYKTKHPLDSCTQITEDLKRPHKIPTDVISNITNAKSSAHVKHRPVSSAKKMKDVKIGSEKYTKSNSEDFERKSVTEKIHAKIRLTETNGRSFRKTSIDNSESRQTVSESVICSSRKQLHLWKDEEKKADSELHVKGRAESATDNVVLLSSVQEKLQCVSKSRNNSGKPVVTGNVHRRTQVVDKGKGKDICHSSQSHKSHSERKEKLSHSKRHDSRACENKILSKESNSERENSLVVRQCSSSFHDTGVSNVKEDSRYLVSAFRGNSVKDRNGQALRLDIKEAQPSLDSSKKKCTDQSQSMADIKHCKTGSQRQNENYTPGEIIIQEPMSMICRKLNLDGWDHLSSKCHQLSGIDSGTEICAPERPRQNHWNSERLPEPSTSSKQAIEKRQIFTFDKTSRSMKTDVHQEPYSDKSNPEFSDSTKTSDLLLVSSNYENSVTQKGEKVSSHPKQRELHKKSTSSGHIKKKRSSTLKLFLKILVTATSHVLSSDGKMKTRSPSGKKSAPLKQQSLVSRRDLNENLQGTHSNSSLKMTKCSNDPRVSFDPSEKNHARYSATNTCNEDREENRLRGSLDMYEGKVLDINSCSRVTGALDLSAHSLQDQNISTVDDNLAQHNPNVNVANDCRMEDDPLDLTIKKYNQISDSNKINVAQYTKDQRCISFEKDNETLSESMLKKDSLKRSGWISSEETSQISLEGPQLENSGIATNSLAEVSSSQCETPDLHYLNSDSRAIPSTQDCTTETKNGPSTSFEHDKKEPQSYRESFEWISEEGSRGSTSISCDKQNNADILLSESPLNLSFGSVDLNSSFYEWISDEENDGRPSTEDECGLRCRNELESQGNTSAVSSSQDRKSYVFSEDKSDLMPSPEKYHADSKVSSGRFLDEAVTVEETKTDSICEKLVIKKTVKEKQSRHLDELPAHEKDHADSTVLNVVPKKACEIEEKSPSISEKKVTEKTVKDKQSHHLDQVSVHEKNLADSMTSSGRVLKEAGKIEEKKTTNISEKEVAKKTVKEKQPHYLDQVLVHVKDHSDSKASSVVSKQAGKIEEKKTASISEKSTKKTDKEKQSRHHDEGPAHEKDLDRTVPSISKKAGINEVKPPSISEKKMRKTKTVNKKQSYHLDQGLADRKTFCVVSENTSKIEEKKTTSISEKEVTKKMDKGKQSHYLDEGPAHEKNLTDRKASGVVSKKSGKSGEKKTASISEKKVTKKTEKKKQSLHLDELPAHEKHLADKKAFGVVSKKSGKSQEKKTTSISEKKATKKTFKEKLSHHLDQVSAHEKDLAECKVSSVVSKKAGQIKEKKATKKTVKEKQTHHLDHMSVHEKDLADNTVSSVVSKKTCKIREKKSPSMSDKKVTEETVKEKQPCHVDIKNKGCETVMSDSESDDDLPSFLFRDEDKLDNSHSQDISDSTYGQDSAYSEDKSDSAKCDFLCRRDQELNDSSVEQTDSALTDRGDTMISPVEEMERIHIKIEPTEEFNLIRNIKVEPPDDQDQSTCVTENQSTAVKVEAFENDASQYNYVAEGLDDSTRFSSLLTNIKKEDYLLDLQDQHIVRDEEIGLKDVHVSPLVHCDDEQPSVSCFSELPSGVENSIQKMKKKSNIFSEKEREYGISHKDSKNETKRDKNKQFSENHSTLSQPFESISPCLQEYNHSRQDLVENLNESPKAVICSSERMPEIAKSSSSCTLSGKERKQSQSRHPNSDQTNSTVSQKPSHQPSLSSSLKKPSSSKNDKRTRHSFNSSYCNFSKQRRFKNSSLRFRKVASTLVKIPKLKTKSKLLTQKRHFRSYASLADSAENEDTSGKEYSQGYCKSGAAILDDVEVVNCITEHDTVTIEYSERTDKSEKTNSVPKSTSTNSACDDAYLSKCPFEPIVKGSSSPDLSSRNLGNSSHSLNDSNSGILSVVSSAMDISCSDESEISRTCDTCGKLFKSQNALSYHMRIHGERRHKCEVCEKNFYSVNHLRRHMIVHTGGKLMKCNVCNKILCRERSMKIHMLKHTPVRPDKNTEVGEAHNSDNEKADNSYDSFNVNNTSRLHCETLNPQKNVGDTDGHSDECRMDENATFAELKNTGKPIEICPAATATNLHSGRGSTWSRANSTTTCEDSQVSLIKSERLSEEFVTTEDPKDGIVTKSGSSFRHNSDDVQTNFPDIAVRKPIKEQDRYHHKCEVCDKEYRSRALLEQHMGVHTGNRGKCDVCDSLLSYHATLAHHITKPAEKKLYECSNCNDCFMVPFELKSLNIIQRPISDSETANRAEGHSMTSVDQSKRSYSDSPHCRSDTVVACGESVSHQDIADVKLNYASERFPASESNDIGDSSDFVQARILNECLSEDTNKNLQVTGEKKLEDSPVDLMSVSNVVDTSITKSTDMSGSLLTPKSEEYHVCNVCEKSFPNLPALSKHMKVHGEKSHRCEVCSKDFLSTSLLQKHMNVHTGNRVKCDVCDKLLSSSAKLKYHMTKHTGEKRLKCNDSGESFSIQSELATHKVIHGSVPGSNCDVHKNAKVNNEPVRIFDFSISQMHMAASDEEQVEDGTENMTADPWGEEHGTASESEHVSASSEYVEVGIMIECISEDNNKNLQVTGENPPVTMMSVDTSTTKSTDMSVSLLTPKSEEYHVCNVCEKSFQNLPALSKHMKVHGEKIHRCEVCSKDFLSTSLLQKHMNVHTGNRVKCDVCDKLLSSHAKLKYHMTKHTGEKRLKCNDSGESFSIQSELATHKVIHGSVPGSNCDVHKNAKVNNEPVRIFDSSISQLHMAASDEEQVEDGTENMTADSWGEEHGTASESEHVSASSEYVEVGIKIECINEDNNKNLQVTGENPPVTMMSVNTSTTKSTDMSVSLLTPKSEEYHVCNVCEKSFQNLPALSKHMKVHDEKIHRCEVCSKDFVSTSLLQKHMNVHTGNCVKCEVCDKLLSSSAKLKYHMTKHTGEKRLKCNDPGESFSIQSELGTHKALHESVPDSECDVHENAKVKNEPVSIGDTSISEKHLAASDEEQVEEETVITTAAASDQDHGDDVPANITAASSDEEHDDDVPANIDAEDETKATLERFRDSPRRNVGKSRSLEPEVKTERLSDHSLQALNETQKDDQDTTVTNENDQTKRSCFNSPHFVNETVIICGQSLSHEDIADVKSNITSEIFLETTQSSDLVEAAIRTECSNEDNNQNLEVIGGKKLEDSPVGISVSNVVATSTSNSTDMSGSLLNAKNEEFHVCNVCEKSFQNLPALSNHMKVHGEKIHRCEVCSKDFLSTSLLKKHMNVHTGNRVKCDVCDKLLSSHAKLKYHMAVHTGEKRFLCNDCGESFTNPSELATHKAKHDSVLDTECDVLENATVKNKPVGISDSSVSQMLMPASNEEQVEDKIENITATTSEHKHSDDLPADLTVATSNEEHDDVPENITAVSSDEEESFDVSAGIVAKEKTKAALERFTNSPQTNVSKSCSQKPEVKTERLSNHSFQEFKKAEKDTTMKNVNVQSSSDSPKVKSEKLHLKKSPESKPKTKPTTHESEYLDENTQSDEKQNTDSRDSYNCFVCGKIFTCRSALSHHKIIHNERTYKCQICDKKFYSNSNLSQHMTVHTGGNPATCKICNKTLSCGSKMKVHMRIHTKEKPYECTDCGKCFSVWSSLKSHRLTHNTMSVKCKFCDKVFRDPKLLERHAKIHGERKFKCEFCGKPFKRSAHLRNHLIVHDEQKDFKCYVCAATFPDGQALQQHLNIHTDKKDYKCDVCGKQFSSFEHLREHLRSHAGLKPFKCDICGKAFTHEGTIKVHMRLHTGERPYSCQICGKSFTQSTHLRTHQRVHKEKRVECENCDRKFFSIIELEEHMKTHSVLKSYECDACKCRFYSERSIKKHKLGFCKKTVKPFQCEKCECRFTNAGTLREHKKRHEQEGEFPCNHCNKIFPMLFKLEKHKKVVHGVGNFICCLCDSSFTTAELHNSHMNEHKSDSGFQCSKCNEVIPDLADLKHHMKKHIKPGPKKSIQKCDLCNITFSRRSKLKSHIDRKHKSSDEPAMDSNESSPLSSLDQKSVHNTDLPSASKDKNQSEGSGLHSYKCQKCGNEYSKESHLKRHISKRHDNLDDAKSVMSPSRTKKNEESTSNDVTVLFDDEVSSKETDIVSASPNKISIEVIETTSKTDHHRRHKSKHSTSRKDSNAKKHDGNSKTASTEPDTTLHISETSQMDDVAADPLPSKDYAASAPHSSPREKATQYKAAHKDKDQRQLSVDSEADVKKFKCEVCKKRYVDLDHLTRHKKRHSKCMNTSNETQNSEHSLGRKKLDQSSSDQISSESKDEAASASKKHNNASVPSTSKSSQINEAVPKSSPSKLSKGYKVEEKPSTTKEIQKDKVEEKPSTSEEIQKDEVDCLPSTLLSSNDVKPFKCDKCDRCYSESACLEKHRKKHDGRGISSETVTDNKRKQPDNANWEVKESPSPKKLKRESDKMDGEKRFSCDVCHKTYSDPGFLKHHMKKHSDDCQKCDHCGRTFSDLSHLQQHIVKHHNDQQKMMSEPKPAILKTYKCDVCEKTFTSNRSLKEHTYIHTGEQPYKCKFCTKCFGDHKSLDVHERRHVGIREHSCEVCGKKFYEAQSLKIHMRVHTGETPYKCPVCGKGCSELGGLKSHLKIHTGCKPHKCDICNRAFAELSAMKLHRMTHEKDRPYKCEICGKGFIKADFLTKHIRVHTNDRPFKCEECGKSFTTKAYLSGHLLTHNNERNFKCDVCEATFKSSSCLHIHKKMHTDVKPFKCNECGKRFRQSSGLLVHRMTHIDERPYTCEQCDSKFRNKSALMKHQLTHTERSRQFVCEICKQGFFTQVSLKKHKKTHLEFGSYKCNVCGVSLLSSGALVTHMRIHRNELPFECKTCGKRFRQISNMRTHMRTHTGIKPYKCTICDREFSHSPALRRHMMEHNGEKPKQYECPICHKTLSGGLKGHMKIHSEERPFKCSLCEDSFKRQDSLRSHMKTHTGEKNFSCDICKKSFSQSSSLSTHMRYHRGERPYKCELCGKTFTQASHRSTHIKGVHKNLRNHKCPTCGKSFHSAGYLRSHMMSHTGEKPFKCKVCDKRFSRSGSLKSHMLVHSGVKNYKCDLCEKTFTHANTLKCHMRYHTGEKPYACDQCDAAFPRLDSLQLHKLSHTGERPFSCKICNSTFKSAPSLKSHMSMHSGSSYPCDVCGKILVSKASLKTHQRTHTGDLLSCDQCEKTFISNSTLKQHKTYAHSDSALKCEICGKILKRPDSLKAHMKIHKEKQYECKECGKKFHRSAGLKNHMFTHNPEDYPHKCEKCGKSFPLLCNLKKHELIHLDDLPFHCQFCEKGFAQKSNMKKHIELHHEEEEEEEEDLDSEEGDGEKDSEVEDEEFSEYEEESESREKTDTYDSD